MRRITREPSETAHDPVEILGKKYQVPEDQIVQEDP